MSEQDLETPEGLKKHYDSLIKYNPAQPRDEKGRWTAEGGGGGDVKPEVPGTQHIKKTGHLEYTHNPAADGGKHFHVEGRGEAGRIGIPENKEHHVDVHVTKSGDGWDVQQTHTLYDDDGKQLRQWKENAIQFAPRRDAVSHYKLRGVAVAQAENVIRMYARNLNPK